MTRAVTIRIAREGTQLRGKQKRGAESSHGGNSHCSAEIVVASCSLHLHSPALEYRVNGTLEDSRREQQARFAALSYTVSTHDPKSSAS